MIPAFNAVGLRAGLRKRRSANAVEPLVKQVLLATTSNALNGTTYQTTSADYNAAGRRFGPTCLGTVRLRRFARFAPCTGGLHSSRWLETMGPETTCDRY